jgi:tetratricopeptide (TPR) repeat protein
MALRIAVWMTGCCVGGFVLWTTPGEAVEPPVVTPAAIATEAGDNPESLSGQAQLDAILNRAQARLAARDPDGALAAADALLARAPASQAALLARARARRMLGASEAAKSDFEAILSLYRTRQRTWQRARVRQHATGGRRVVRPPRPAPNPTWAVAARLELAEAALAGDAVEQAGEHLDVARAYAPFDNDVERIRRQAREFLGLPAESLTQEEVAPKAAEDSIVIAPLQLKRALDHYAAGRFRAAVADATGALERLPGDTRALLCRAHAHARLGEHAAAVADFSSVLELGPVGSDVRLYRAFSLAELGRLKEAHRDTNAVLAKEPDNFHAILQDGSVLLGLGRLQEARARFNDALSRRPGHPRALLHRGLTHYKDDDLLRALADFRQAAASQSAPARAHHLTALVFYREARDTEALAALDKGLSLHPEHGRMHYLRALVLVRQSKPRAALPVLTRAIELGENTGELILTRAAVRAQLGDAAGAATDYARAEALFSQARLGVAAASGAAAPTD